MRSSSIFGAASTGQKGQGRGPAAALFLEQARGKRGASALIVRTHALDSGEVDSDLDAVMAGAPDAILLPGSLGAAKAPTSFFRLSFLLAVREARLSLADGATRIIAVADTAQSLFGMGSYRGSSARLLGIAWSAEALRADIGAEVDRDPRGGALGPYRLARDLTLLAAASAGVAAIDAAFPDIHDADGLCVEAVAARRPGLPARWRSTRPKQHIINDTFPARSKG